MDKHHVFEIQVYSHFFKVLRPTERALPVILRFCSRYTIYQWVKEGRGKPVYKPTKVFGVRTRNNREFRFHIGQFNDFMDIIAKEYIAPTMYKISYAPMYTPANIQCSLNPDYVLRDDQQAAENFILESAPGDNSSRLAAMPTGSGKLQPLSARIKIPGGWSTMGEMQPGTEVIARDGTTAVVTNVYPQGLKEVYKITFSDNRSTECGLEHLWKVYNSDWRNGPKVIDTKELLRLNNVGREPSRLYIDLCDSEQNVDIELPIDPYMLGALLGDGSMSTRLDITTPDQHRLTEILPEDLQIKHRDRISYGIVKRNTKGRDKNSYIILLKSLGLLGKVSHQKFIPSVYFNGSTQQRLALLQGLLDTDGTADAQGTVSFCSSSKELAEGVQYLVRSLGGLASIRLRFPTYTYKGEKRKGRLAYQVNIRYPRPEELFTLPKKKERTNNNNQYAATLKLRVERIERIGLRQTQCIAIDHPEHLYVTDDFIVTHNTVLAMSCVSKIRHRTLVLILPTYVEKWQGDIVHLLNHNPKKIVSIAGSNSVKGLIDMGLDGTLDSDFIIVSLRTLQNFYKTYEFDPSSLEEEGYGCVPEALCEVLGIGTVIIDEAHQHLHAVYKFLAYTHVPKVIALSATLLSDDPTIQQIQHLMFPMEIRFNEIKMKKYIKCYSVSYAFNDIQRSNIRTSEYGSKVYSHVAFEKSILKNPVILKHYLELIDYLVAIGFMDFYQKGDRCIIFVASIAFCDVLTNYLKQKYPFIDTRRYVEQDPYENVIDADIRVTTALSAGTAVDIPGLTTGIQTVNLKSSQSNIQTMGRLRELKDRDTRFYYIYCNSIPKHYEFHKHRIELFKERVASIKELSYPYPL